MVRPDRSITLNHVAQVKFDYALITLYFFCMIPVTYDGFGVNYLFTLIPLGALVFGSGLVSPSSAVVKFIFGCVAVFLVATLYQINWLDSIDRRFVSFVLFMAMFSMCFVRLTQKHIISFKIAVVLVAAVFSLQSLVVFSLLGVEAQSFESKNVVGSQRFGFMYIVAYWIVWYDDRFLIKSKIAKSVVLTILLLGVALTFSRASIVGFIISGLASIIHGLYTTRQFNFVKLLNRIFYGSVWIFMSLSVVHFVAPIIFEFHMTRLIDYVLSGDSSYALLDPDTSEGARMFIWANIVDFVLSNPLTGSGFLGVWILSLFEASSGSAHNQYMDVLFRIGLPLFIIYCYILFDVTRRLNKVSPELFVGFIGILVYGLFHETFKEPYGGFVFSMLANFSVMTHKARSL